MFSNRRDFLKKVGGIALAGSVIPDVWAANLVGKPRISKIGVQLYTAMGAMEQDTEGTLRAIAEIGYKELETAGSRKGGYYGKSAKEFAAFAKELGMSWKSHHITAAPRTSSSSTNTAGRPAMKTLRDNYQEVVDDMAAAGVPFLVCSSAPIKTLDEVKQSLRNSGRHVSMDAPFVQGEENSLLDVLENDGDEKPDDGLMTDSLRKEVQRALSTLTQREADVITLYFGLNGEHAMTLEEIGEKFNLTRERVRQIKEKAIRRLRHTSRSKTLKPYLG